MRRRRRDEITVAIYLSDGSALTIHDFQADTLLELRADLDEGESRFITLTMDEGVVLVARDSIVRVDID